MKTMRKIFTLVLSMMMLLSMAVTANANEETATYAMQDQSRVIIHGAGAGTTYKLYRILDIAAVGEDSQGYERIVYTLRADTNAWNEFFTNETYAKDYFEISGDYVKTVKFKGGYEDTDEKTAQKLAELAAKYIQDKNITEDGKRDVTFSGTQTGDPRQIGYYVMISNRTVGTGDDDFLKHNVFTLKKGENKEIIEKNDLVHSITKYVREDSDVVAGVDTSGWTTEENAAEIGQPVEFKIIVDLAPGTESYTIRDIMENFEKLENLNVSYSGGDEAFVQNEDYTATINPEQNGFEIVLNADFCTAVQDSDHVTITYTAYLTADANIAGDGNENKAELHHGTTKVDEDTTYTHTYKAIINKKNENKAPLPGAKFVLKAGSSTAQNNTKFSKVDDTPYTVVSKEGTRTTVNVPTYVIDPDVKNPVEIIETDANGIFALCGLDSFDEYYLVETEAPQGYIIADPQLIQIIPGDDGNYVYEIDVVNLPGVEMPETGGMGTTVFYVAGGILVLAAIALLVTKKRTVA